MSISEEFEKLKKSKSAVRKSIQRKNTGLTLETIYADYDDFIRGMNDTRTPDEDNLINYVEDRVYFLEVSVNRIRPYAFRYLTCLQQLYLNSSEVVVLENINAFHGISPKILVPSNLVSAYKSANNWSLIADRIFPYDSDSSEEMYLLQHIDHVQKVSWVGTKTLAELQKEFRN